MMAETEVVRRAKSDMAKFIQAQGKAKRELQAKTVAFYRDYIIKGKSDAEARALIMERLQSQGLTERKMKKYIENPAEVSNPKAMALSDAKLHVWLGRTTADIDAIREEVNDKLMSLASKDDEEMIVVELATSGPKAKPAWMLRIELLERKADALDRFYTAYKNLYGNNQLLNVNITGGANELLFEDLDRQIRELKEKNRIVETDATEV
jgi:hypothetical protein